MLYFNNKNLNELFDGFQSAAKNAYEGALIEADVTENDKAYLVSVNLPGVAKENVGIDFKDGTIYINVKKEDAKKDKDEKYLIHERNTVYGKRSFYLGECESESIKAKLENGVLNVVVPKKELKENESQSINIE